MNSMPLIGLSVSRLVSLLPSLVGSYEPLREATLLDDMLCHGEYEQALKLARRNLQRTDFDKTLVVPYIAALFIDTGRLQDAESVLNSAGSSSIFASEIGRAAIARERAALFLACQKYDLAATEAIKAYRLAQEDSLTEVRMAYAGSIAAEALVRLGDLDDARYLAHQILKAVPRGVKRARFFVPRILYAAALVETYAGSPERAEAICLRGVSFSEKGSSQTRDVSLGYLVLAEIRLKAANMTGSIDAAQHAMFLTERLFGPAHQDIFRARDVLLQALDKRPGEAHSVDIRHYGAGIETRSAAGYTGPADSANAQSRSVARLGYL